MKYLPLFKLFATRSKFICFSNKYNIFLMSHNNRLVIENQSIIIWPFDLLSVRAWHEVMSWFCQNIPYVLYLNACTIPWFQKYFSVIDNYCFIVLLNIST